MQQITTSLKVILVLVILIAVILIATIIYRSKDMFRAFCKSKEPSIKPGGTQERSSNERYSQDFSSSWVYDPNLPIPEDFNQLSWSYAGSVHSQSVYTKMPS